MIGDVREICTPRVNQCSTFGFPAKNLKIHCHIKYSSIFSCSKNLYTQSLRHFSGIMYRDGTAGGKSQIVRTPLRVIHVSAGKPDWIFLARFESINGRAKSFK